MEAERAAMLDRWERAAPGWGRGADRIREMSMPLSAWMIEQLALQPGQRVLELAAGPGDTGFLAAELIYPEGSLISSDASEAMLKVARERAEELRVPNVQFMQLELEWIDLPTASVDAALCRWALMLSVDPAAAAGEVRRVLRPGGRIAVAVWDGSELNPWATIPGRALVELGHAEPADDPDAPGMFALAPAGRLGELLESGGFLDVIVEGIDLERSCASIDAYIEETLELSPSFAEALERIAAPERRAVHERIGELVEPFVEPDGAVRLPARSLAAAASA